MTLFIGDEKDSCACVGSALSKVQRLPCVNQTHFMQMMDDWGFQRVLHYSTSDGMNCAIYCQAVGDGITASRDMCLGVFSANRSGEPMRVHEIASFVQKSYMDNSHAPLRNGSGGVQHTPNGGSLRTWQDLGAWCDTVTDALTRFHVIVNISQSKKRKILE
jgi:hypothetical protein